MTEGADVHSYTASILDVIGRQLKGIHSNLYMVELQVQITNKNIIVLLKKSTAILQNGMMYCNVML